MFKLYKIEETSSKIIYQIEAGLDAKGAIIFCKNEKCLTLSKNSDFYFFSLNLDSIRNSLIDFQRLNIYFPDQFYFLFEIKNNHFYFYKWLEDAKKVEYFFYYLPASGNKITTISFNRLKFVFYKKDKKGLLEVQDDNDKVFIKHVSSIQNFFKQFNSSDFPNTFIMNVEKLM